MTLVNEELERPIGYTELFNLFSLWGKVLENI
jgi:hypothetical protein